MSMESLHADIHDYPEIGGSPSSPVDPLDPTVMFPQEFPFPDTGYTGPLVVIDDLEGEGSSADVK